jgi:amidase
VTDSKFTTTPAPPLASRSAFDLSPYDATALAELIRTKRITASELVEITIRKIEAVNPTLNAIVHRTYDRARRRAVESLSDDPFGGVPFLVKDNAVIAGVPIARGCRALLGHVPERTAPFFNAIERTGLNVLGVTNMPELGLIDGTESALYGPARNPWHLDYSPGGSSGGSAAAVAAGILPMAHGTDGGGSIRMPASHCGLFGLKVSRGRLLSGSSTARWWEFLVDGVLSRTVRDMALLISVAEDPSTPLPRMGFVPPQASRPLKIAVMYRGLQGQIPHADVREAVADAAQLCRELGHSVEQAEPELAWQQLDTASRQVGAVETAMAVDAIVDRRGYARLEEAFESRALGLRKEAMRNGAFEKQIAEALPVLRDATYGLDQFFQQWDVLLTPVARTPIYEIGMRDQSKHGFEILDDRLSDYACYTRLHNICGTPAMSVPLYWDRSGLPIGSQFAARTGAEATLLALAYRLEDARPWVCKRPPVFAK